MTTREIRGYAVALTLLGFSGAWAATAHDARTKPASPTTTTSAAAAPDARLVALARRRTALARRAREVRTIIARRRAEVARPAPVQIVSVPGPSYASGSSGGGSVQAAPSTSTRSS